MARAGAPDPVWPKVAPGLLHRHRPLVLRPCRDRTEPKRVVDSDCRRRDRNVADDSSRLLRDAVERAGSRAFFAGSNWRARMIATWGLIWPAMTAAFLASLVE